VDSVVWSGPGPVDVFLALDGGFNWTLLRERVEESPLTLQVPHVPTRFAKIRLVSSLGEEPAAESDSFFVIRSEVSLSKFVAANSDEGVELAWETDPMPPAIAGYRVERAIGGGAYAALHAGLLGGGGFTDRSRSSGARYRLIAINGLGEEYVLGETSVAGALAADRDIIAYPNPASGPMEILYRVPFDRPIDLTIYDLSGRRVRSLVAGRQPVGVQSATWDRRDEAGRDVAAGPYFARLTSGDGFTATERITIVR
jgi:hypothetical protein